MNEVTLLSYEQIFGNNKLDIFNKIEPKAFLTDFAILIGGSTFGTMKYNIFYNRGNYWTKSNTLNNKVCVINLYGCNIDNFLCDYTRGIRPALSYTNIKDNISNEIINKNGITEVEYGEYPQYAANKVLQEELEELYKSNKLNKTGKTYTTGSKKYYGDNKDFLPQEHIEYEFDNKKYVRVKATSHIDYSGVFKFKLSNYKEYFEGDYVWVEVSKIKWLVDEENDIALSKNILVAGIQFDNKEEYTGDFENTNMYKFLNTYFIKDIQIQEKYIDISKISGTYEEAMALIEEAKRRHNAILDKSIIGKTLIKHL